MTPYYDFGGIKIYCGDCREIMPYLPQIGLVNTDPPYNLGKNYGKNINDKMKKEVYWSWFKEVYEMIFGLVGDGYLYSSHTDRGIYVAKPILESIGFGFIQNIIWWGKNGYSCHLHKVGWSYRHEIIQMYKKGKPKNLLVGGKGEYFQSVIEVPRPQRNYKSGRYHTAQKPFKLYRKIVKRHQEETVFDPFMGSGTTLLSAQVFGKYAIGIDIEEKNCEIAAQRLMGVPPMPDNQKILPFIKRGDYV